MRTTGLVLLVLLSVGMGGYAAYTYGLRPIGVGVHPAMQAEYERQPVAVYTHIFGALVAMVVGPFQFSTRLRAKRLRLHRVLGRLYLGVGVLVGGFAGLYVSTFAFGGIVGRAGNRGIAPPGANRCRGLRSLRGRSAGGRPSGAPARLRRRTATRPPAPRP